jgi:hypothetical protein
MDVFRGRAKEEKEAKRLGDNVRVTRDRLTEIPRRVVEIDAYPAGLEEGAVPVTKKNAESTFKAFLGEHKEVFEIEPEDLELVSARQIGGRWYVKYRQHYKGIPVHHATVGLDSSETGKVGSYAASYHPDIDVPTEPSVNLDDATDIALRTYPEEGRARLRRKDDTLLIYPEEAEDHITYHLAWKFLIVGEEPDPELEKYFIVDALDGEIIESYNARFPGAQVTGTVQGEIYPRNPTDPISTMPIRNKHVEIEDAGTATTNGSGDYRKTVSWVWQFSNWPFGQANFSLNGPYARVQDNNGADYNESRDCNTSSPCNLTWTAADRDHINVFYHMNLFHDWLVDELGYSWVNPWDGTSRFNARVNYSFANAYAGDPMQFGTNPFARSSDVIYHECTHNVLYQIYGDYIGWPNAYTEAYAMDEGFADYFACSFTNDSRHGEGYSASPRDLNNSAEYPGRSSYNSEGHSGGTIIGGAAWDLRQRLINVYGSPGARIADQLFLEAHQILSTYPRDYYFSDPHESNLLSALYRAADTDNDLLNGFPYFNDIQHAFHAHALLQAVLHDRDSFDFSTNTLGTLTGGDLYYSGGKFWANNVNQRGVTDLGSVGNADLATVNIPTTGYTRFGVDAVSGHTYVSKAQEGELGSYIVFRVSDISADKSQVTLRYFYRFNPWWYVANVNSKEIHRLDCHWVSLMAAGNKLHCEDLQEVAELIEVSGYNGCHFCLPRYDTDTLTIQRVLENLNEDLQ